MHVFLLRHDQLSCSIKYDICNKNIPMLKFFPKELLCAIHTKTCMVLLARNCDLHFGGRDVARQRVELIDRCHVVQFVHDVSLHQHTFTVPLGPTRS